MRIGIIGTGLIGEPIAKKILEANYKLNVFNRTKSKTTNLEKEGANICSEIPSLISDSDIILLILSDFDAIEEVLFENNVSNYEGKTIIQMGTIAPAESNYIKDKINNLRGEYFEAPILGSIPQIKNKELIILAGCSKLQLKKYSKFFLAFSNKINHIGEVGKASSMKLALNQLIITETIAFSMSIGYLQENDNNINQFMSILRDSSLYAATFDKKLPKMLTRDFQNPNFPLKHLLKDLDLILGDFGENNINTNALKGIRKVLINSIKKGNSENDYSSLYEGIHPK